jgi:hypothetical protein
VTEVFFPKIKDIFKTLKDLTGDKMFFRKSRKRIHSEIGQLRASGSKFEGDTSIRPPARQV